MSPASDIPGEIQGGPHQCWAHIVPVSLSPEPGRAVSPNSLGSILQQPGEVTGAIPQLCVTRSNDTLHSLSSQGSWVSPLLRHRSSSLPGWDVAGPGGDTG